MKNYEIIDHTADFSFQVFGKDLKDLFISSAFALLEIIFGKILPENSKLQKIKIILKSNDYESLLIDWLREIHYLAIVEKKTVRKISKFELMDLQIIAELEMQKIDIIPENEIKAITYSNIRITEKDGMLSFIVVCDV